MEPKAPPAHRLLWDAFYLKGMYPEALAEARKYFEMVGDAEVANLLVDGEPRADYHRAMSRAAHTLEAHVKLTHVSPLLVAQLYAHSGGNERALEWLEKSYEQREPFLVYISINPLWDNVRDTPRFKNLLRQMGL